MKFIGVIPARYASTRLPGKPLADIHGKPMIQWVYENARKALDRVIVATDDRRVFDAVEAFGGEVMMTATDHQSGTDRIGEVARKLGNSWNEDDVVVNIQGDEPFIQARQIELLVSLFQDKKVKIGTLVKKIDQNETLHNPNIPKVVLGKSSYALLFSRAAIPFARGVENEAWLKHHAYYKHIGMYAYRVSTLLELVQLPLGKLEQAESLEQLRWLENGFQIKVAITDLESLAVDTPEDLEKARRFAD
jgi:3-deoxy-manno-octulosonate cytidylyltransferase (CMP-KDO synthetase)